MIRVAAQAADAFASLNPAGVVCQQKNCRHSGAPAASMQANPESMLLSSKDQYGFRVPPANNAGGPGMTR
jgi:hypothetical protein